MGESECFSTSFREKPRFLPLIQFEHSIMLCLPKPFYLLILNLSTCFDFI